MTELTLKRLLNSISVKDLITNAVEDPLNFESHYKSLASKKFSHNN